MLKGLHLKKPTTDKDDSIYLFVYIFMEYKLVFKRL